MCFLCCGRHIDTRPRQLQPFANKCSLWQTCRELWWFSLCLPQKKPSDYDSPLMWLRDGGRRPRRSHGLQRGPAPQLHERGYGQGQNRKMALGVDACMDIWLED